MDVLINGLMAVAGIAALMGLAALIKPYWRLRRRWQGGALLAAALVVGGALQSVPPGRPADVTPSAWAQRLSVCRDANAEQSCPLSTLEVAKAQADVDARRAKLDASRREAARSTAEAAQAASPEGRSASFVTTQVRMTDVVTPCDAAVATAARTHGQYASYVVSRQAAARCRQAMSDLLDLHFPPEIAADHGDALNAGVRCMGMAYGERASAMEAAAVIMDGDARPSKVSSVRGELSEAAARVNECAQQYARAAHVAGYDKEVISLSQE